MVVSLVIDMLKFDMLTLPRWLWRRRRGRRWRSLISRSQTWPHELMAEIDRLYQWREGDQWGKWEIPAPLLLPAFWGHTGWTNSTSMRIRSLCYRSIGYLQRHKFRSDASLEVKLLMTARHPTWKEGGAIAGQGRFTPPSIDGSKMGSLPYAILGCLLRNCFVSLLWIQPTDTQGRGNPRCVMLPIWSLRVLSRFLALLLLFQRPPPPPSWRNEKTGIRSCSLEPNPTRKTALETTGSTTRRLRRIKMGC